MEACSRASTWFTRSSRRPWTGAWSAICFSTRAGLKQRRAWRAGKGFVWHPRTVGVWSQVDREHVDPGSCSRLAQGPATHSAASLAAAHAWQTQA